MIVSVRAQMNAHFLVVPYQTRPLCMCVCVVFLALFVQMYAKMDREKQKEQLANLKRKYNLDEEEKQKK